MMDPTDNEILTAVSTLILGAVVIVCISWIIVTIIVALKQRANVRTRANILGRLIDKFGDTSEFVSFLATETGSRFVEEQTFEAALPISKILGAVQRGTILSLLGMGMLAIGLIFGASLGGDLYIILTVGGTAGLMVGIGFLISSAISYRLCRAWGILKGKEPE